jgi:hypothetical protein
MSYKISYKSGGWIVETLEIKWTLFGLKKTWIPFVKTSGMDYCWHHQTYESALRNLLKEIEKNHTIHEVI